MIEFLSNNQIFYFQTQLNPEGHLSALGCRALFVKGPKRVRENLRDTHLWSGLTRLVAGPWQKRTNDHCASSRGQTTLDALCL